jgi:hypothetical protein
VVQCKHYTGSGFAKLVSDLRNKEVPKLARLTPSRYLIVTSVGLTPDNKHTLQTLLAPYCKSESDIFGRDDLNNLLGKYPEIERQHLKLWISSTVVLESIIHSQLINTSAEEIDKIRRRSRVYVHNASINEAIKILNQHNVCIIAGIPGIGKTTLAEMLVLYYLRNGYELVRITSNIHEASALGLGAKRRVYYYDDFLGQSSDADKLAKNEDQRLLDFIEAVRHSKLSKLILTTREYILNQARSRYEKLSRVRFSLETCIVDLQKYTRLNRGEILFNHLYFSDLPTDFKRSLLAEAGYLKIIDHPNYNPRFVDLLTRLSNVSGLHASEYLSFFLGKLSNPSELWEHAFHRQLGCGSRDILVVLTSMPRSVLLDDLRAAFQSYHAARCGHFTIPADSSDFMSGCRELDGNFVSCTKSEGQVSTGFHNASIRDFIQSYCSTSHDEMLILMRNAVFFEQLLWLSEFKLPDQITPVFDAFIAFHAEDFVQGLERTFLAESCLTRPSWGYWDGAWTYAPVKVEAPPESRLEHLIAINQKIQSTQLSLLIERFATVVVKRCLEGAADREALINLIESATNESPQPNIANKLIEAARDYLTKELDELQKFKHLAQFISICPERFPPEKNREISLQFESFTDSDINSWLDGSKSDDADEVRDCANTIKEVAGVLGLDVSQKIEALNEVADEKEAFAKHDQMKSDDNHRQASQGIEGTNAEIASLFETLPT